MTKLQEIASRHELFVNLTLRELRGKYKRSFLGWAWSLLNPLTSMLLYSFVFGYILEISPETGEPSGLKNFPLYLLCGLLPFNFLAMSLNGGMGSLIGNSNLIKKTYFPREIMVAANTASWLVSFLIEMGLLVVALLIVGNAVLVWLPAVLMLMALQTMFVLGLALALSAAAVYFRDLEHLLGLVLQAWFYSAPIVYPMSQAPEWLRPLLLLSPMSAFVVAYQRIFYYGEWPEVSIWVAALAYGVGAFAAGAMWFLSLEERLGEQV